MRYVCLACALFLFGCGTTPTTQISALGESTSAITGKVDAVMEEYNAAALERIFTDYAATYNGDYADRLTREELAKIEKPITPEQKKVFAMYKANQALGAYAKALGELASAGGQVDIDLAAANLYGSMSSINDQYKTLKDTDRDLFDAEDLNSAATLIAAVGHAIVERKRKAAIKKIVIDADPKVALICDEIHAQLRVAGIEDAIATSRAYILTEELREYRGRAKKSTRLDWRKSEIKRLYQLQQDMFNSKLLVQQTQKAVMAVKNAHATLAAELGKGKFTSAEIAAAIGRLKKLENHYEDFEALLMNCGKVSRNSEGILSCDDE